MQRSLEEYAAFTIQRIAGHYGNHFPPVRASPIQAEYDELVKQINHSLNVMKIAALTDDAETKSEN